MNAIRAIFSAILFTGIFGYALYAVTPGLIRDWTLRTHYEPVAADVTGECNTRAVVLNYCNLTITPENGAAQKDQMFFFDMDTGALSVSAVASPDDPAIMSTNIGVEKFWNRVITLVLLGLVALLIIFGSLADLFKKKEPLPA